MVGVCLQEVFSVTGTVLDVHGDGLTVTHPVPDDEVAAVFADKDRYLRRYQADMAEVVAAGRAAWPEARADLTSALAEWLDPLLAAAPSLRAAIGAPVELDARPVARIVVDVPAGRVRDWEPGDDPPYGFRVDPRLLTAEVDRREPDWCNDLFLSCRFEARRRGGYNDWLYTFFKSLSPERIAYTEAFVRARTEGAVPADMEWIELDGWVVQSRCPHQGASLARMGSVCDDVLTCGLHGWQFDLRSGRCVNGEGVALLVRGRIGDVVELDPAGTDGL
jgi:UDP-MurNAc hydroxylase